MIRVTIYNAHMLIIYCDQCDEVFRFCAIPQVMAIATLEKCYNNPDVFTGVVKIRKGLSCKLIMNTNDMTGVHSVFSNFAEQVAKKANIAKSNGFTDPSFECTIKICDTIRELTHDKASSKRASERFNMIMLAVPGMMLGTYLGSRSRKSF